MEVRYHLPDLPKPQNTFSGHKRSNLNQPFDHVWLERSQDDGNYIHPLEKFTASDFIEQDVSIEPLKPLLLEETSFTLVEEVEQLELLAEKLKSVDEFADTIDAWNLVAGICLRLVAKTVDGAVLQYVMPLEEKNRTQHDWHCCCLGVPLTPPSVDLENNSYRSFQGITCLMQISTRDEDFIVDTLKLRIYVGSYLRDVFKDPLKKKVMHGADNDVLWLQRDFSIYVCNLFDTHQASVVLNVKNHSLE